MSETQTYNCIFCKASFDDKETYQTHFRQHGDPNLHQLIKFKKRSPAETTKIDTDNVKKAGPEMVSCDVCTETFPTISKAITHKHKMHPNHDAKYFCPWCGKLFTMKHLYNKHCVSHDTGDINNEEVFHCDCCEVDFYKPVAVIYHNKFFHRQDTDTPAIGLSKKRKVVCEELMPLYYCCFCGEEYINRVNLQKHMSDDHSDENQCPDEVYRCPLCEAIFYHLDAYEVHLTFHTVDDNYGAPIEIHTRDIEFNLETVPPKIEKVENYEGYEPDNSINSIGIDQFLQLAMDTPAQDDNEQSELEQLKHHKKHKKHKKSKKAITLDQFLTMNKDVFGECLDFQGVEEVPTRVVTNQLRGKKPKSQSMKPGTKVISAANLAKLKQQGIVVKMKNINKAVPILPGVKMNKGPNTIIKKPIKVSNSAVTARQDKITDDKHDVTNSMLSKIINQSNSQIKIVKKPIAETNNDDTKAVSSPHTKNLTNDNDELDSGRESDNDTDHNKHITTDEENTNNEKSESIPHINPNIIKNIVQGPITPVQDNLTLECKQPPTALKNLSQEITIKPMNRTSNTSKAIEKSTDESATNINQFSEDVIHIDNDDEEEAEGVDDNIEDIEYHENDNKKQEHLRAEEKQDVKNAIVKVTSGQNVHYPSTDEDDNSDTEYKIIENMKHEAAINKIKKISHNISLKSVNQSNKVTVKSSNFTKNVNVSQCLKTMKIANYSANIKPAFSNNSNLLRDRLKSIKPKTADSLKVINSFKEMNFTDDDNDDDVHDSDKDNFNTLCATNKCNMVQNFKKFNQETTVKPINQKVPLKTNIKGQTNPMNFDCEEFSDNSNIDSDDEIEDEREAQQLEDDIRKANRNMLTKLQNSNIFIKPTNETLNAPRQTNKQKQETSTSSKLPTKSSNLCTDFKQISDDENFGDEDMQFFENETHDEELPEPDEVVDINKQTVNKLLNSNQAISIKPVVQNKSNDKTTTMKQTNTPHVDQNKSTTLINSLKSTNKNLTIKSVGENKTNNNQDFESKFINQRSQPKDSLDTFQNQNKREASPKSLKHIPAPDKIRNSNSHIKKVNQETSTKPNQIVQANSSNQELANTNQAQTVKQEVTVKTMQTKTETVVEEITTTVTKTIRTINQMQTMNQEMSSVASVSQVKNNEATNMIGKNVKRLQPELRTPINQIKHITQGTNVRPIRPTAQPRMQRPIPNNPIKVSNQVMPMGSNMNQPRPRIQNMSAIKKVQPAPQQQSKPYTGKPLKVSPNVVKQQPRTVNKMPGTDPIGPFNCFKKSKESLATLSDMSEVIPDQTGDVSIASHMSKSQHFTSKIVKTGNVITSSQKSHVSQSLSQQLTRLSNTSGLKIVKSSATKTSNEVERCEASTSKRTALDAIQKLQKQGLLVKKPRMDFDSDISGSGGESDNEFDNHYLQENSDG